jgi:hypothetical protein
VKYAIPIIAILLASASPAHAQRCPAGQDQLGNCYSMDPQMRAKQERWANQPAARQIPGAQPYGQPPINLNPQTGRPYNTETPVYCTRDRWLRGLCK